MTDPIFAIGPWANNAELIAEMPHLGYLRDDWYTLDPTYGLGNFWTKWRPRSLVAHDLDPAKCPDGRAAIDFRKMPYEDATFEAVVFDPPYKFSGTNHGTGPAASNASYGIGTYASVQDRIDLICDGITECFRVLEPGGMLLVKMQDQVVSGKVHWQTRIFADHAESLGCRLVDMLHLVGHRAQPEGRRQVHARRNYSTLEVFQRRAR